MNVVEFLAATGMSLNALHEATGIAYSTLYPHVKRGKRLSLKTAEALAKWSKGNPKGEMTAAKILGLDDAPASSRLPKKRAGKSTKRRKSPATKKTSSISSAAYQPTGTG
jgi:hypothetical protein